jgi:hypothetical protein
MAKQLYIGQQLQHADKYLMTTTVVTHSKKHKKGTAKPLAIYSFQQSYIHSVTLSMPRKWPARHPPPLPAVVAAAASWAL